MTTTRSYKELVRLPTFNERYRYLALRGTVGEPTFGSERYVNQRFYRSRQWQLIRDQVILRDNGCDLGIDGRDIFDRIYIHHINPMTAQSIREADESILDPDNLICVTLQTHNAIHYGDEHQLAQPYVERSPGDTTLWTPRRS